MESYSGGGRSQTDEAAFGTGPAPRPDELDQRRRKKQRLFGVLFRFQFHQQTV